MVGSRDIRRSTDLRDIGYRVMHVGLNSSVDEVSIPDSIAIAQIYRAKGNEAPMVYAVDRRDPNDGWSDVVERWVEKPRTASYGLEGAAAR